jgi:hypothetical protein
MAAIGIQIANVTYTYQATEFNWIPIISCYKITILQMSLLPLIRKVHYRSHNSLPLVRVERDVVHTFPFSALINPLKTKRICFI